MRLALTRIDTRSAGTFLRGGPAVTWASAGQILVYRSPDLAWLSKRVGRLQRFTVNQGSDYGPRIDSPSARIGHGIAKNHATLKGRQCAQALRSRKASPRPASGG